MFIIIFFVHPSNHQNEMRRNKFVSHDGLYSIYSFEGNSDLILVPRLMKVFLEKIMSSLWDEIREIRFSEMTSKLIHVISNGKNLKDEIFHIRCYTCLKL